MLSGREQNGGWRRSINLPFAGRNRMNARQVTGSMQDCRLLGVPPIVPDTLARLARDHRGRDHRAAMAEFGEMAVDAVATSPSFVAELQPMAVFGQTFGQPLQGCRGVRNCTDEIDGSVAILFGRACRNAGLMNIKTDVERLLHGKPLAPPGAPFPLFRGTEKRTGRPGVLQKIQATGQRSVGLVGSQSAKSEDPHPRMSSLPSPA
jgi:hypothetical protein